MPFPTLRLRATALALTAGLTLGLGALPAAAACSPAGLQGLYLWPMSLTAAGRSCQVSVHLMFDGRGRGWMQPVDASCPRPGAPAGASAFRYTVDEECSGELVDAHGRFQLELEREDVELTLERGALRIGGVATRQRDLSPGEAAMIGSKPRLPARPARPEAR